MVHVQAADAIDLPWIGCGMQEEGLKSIATMRGRAQQRCIPLLSPLHGLQRIAGGAGFDRTTQRHVVSDPTEARWEATQHRKEGRLLLTQADEHIL